MLRQIIKTISASFIITIFAIVARADIYSVIVTADSGPGSLRQAIINSNLHPPQGEFPNLIRFDVPGAGVKSIILKSPLPTHE